jgi:hypothetical protein
MRNLFANLASILSRVMRSLRVIVKMVNGALVSTVETVWDVVADVVPALAGGAWEITRALAALPVNALHAVNRTLFGPRAAPPHQIAEQQDAVERQRQASLDARDGDRDSLRAIQSTAAALSKGELPGKSETLLADKTKAYLHALTRDELAIVAALDVEGLKGVRAGRGADGVRAPGELGMGQPKPVPAPDTVDGIAALRSVINARYNGMPAADVDLAALPFCLQRQILTAHRADFQSVWHASDEQFGAIIDEHVQGIENERKSDAAAAAARSKPVPGVSWDHEVAAFKRVALAKVRGAVPGPGAVDMLRPELKAYLQKTDIETLAILQRQPDDVVATALNAMLYPKRAPVEPHVVRDERETAKNGCGRRCWRRNKDFTAAEHNPEVPEGEETEANNFTLAA